MSTYCTCRPHRRDRRAGIRIGSFIERDMVAVRLTRDFRWCVVGSPDYFAAHSRPREPRTCWATNASATGSRRPRRSTAGSFATQVGSSVDAPGSIVVNDHLSMIALALSGAGLACTVDPLVANDLAAGTLRQVLRPYLPVTPGLHLYFPSRSQTRPKLRAFIDFLTRRRPERGEE